MLFAEEDEQVPLEEPPEPDPPEPEPEPEEDGLSGFLSVSRSDFTQPARPL